MSEKEIFTWVRASNINYQVSTVKKIFYFGNLSVLNYSQLSYYTMQLQLHRTINEKNRAGDAPITFEEIGMVMI